MEVDAQTFAFWGVDQVKLDGCYVDVTQMDQGLISSCVQEVDTYNKLIS